MNYIICEKKIIIFYVDRYRLRLIMKQNKTKRKEQII